jgi:hypothetical protein
VAHGGGEASPDVAGLDRRSRIMATIRAKTSYKAIDDNFWPASLQREPAG